MPLNIGQIVKEQGSKAALDQIEKEGQSVEVEATTAGEIEADINAPLKKGLFFDTVTAFVKAPIKTLGQTSAGIRLKKTFGR